MSTLTILIASIYDTLMIIVLLAFVILLVVTGLVLLKAIKALERAMFHPETIVRQEPVKPLEYEEWKALQKSRPSIWNKLLQLKPLEEESNMLLDDEYDGIRELNNPTPAWFMGLFYITIVFAGLYLLNYHVFGWGKLQDAEYASEMRRARQEKAAYLAKADNLVDENTVKLSADAATISTGKAVYVANCVPCHGDHAQGVVGPNLTDEFWLHGGKVNSLFKTIKYGIPDKGMISWENKLSPKQIAGVANYILTLQGTHPANAKAPQGVKD